MHPARSVRAHEYRLFDIAGPRCTGNQVDGARHVTFAQSIPGIFVGADDLAFPNDDNVGVGQEVESRRMIGAGAHNQGTGLRHASECAGQTHFVRAVGGALLIVKVGRFSQDIS